MGGLIDIASAIMSRSAQQIEVASQNVSNGTTPGYKRVVSFERLLSDGVAGSGYAITASVSSDFTPGKLINTGKPYDLALAGAGFFAVGAGTKVFYTRQGQFERDGDGRLVNTQGQALQVEGGGDLRLKSAEVTILEDGSVLEDGVPSAKLSVVDFKASAATAVEGGAFTAPNSSVASLDKPSVHQGSLEASNVSMGTEMVAIMGALRRAETGQRLAMVYDDLMGRVLQTFGQTS